MNHNFLETKFYIKSLVLTQGCITNSKAGSEMFKLILQNNQISRQNPNRDSQLSVPSFPVPFLPLNFLPKISHISNLNPPYIKSLDLDLKIFHTNRDIMDQPKFCLLLAYLKTQTYQFIVVILSFAPKFSM